METRSKFITFIIVSLLAIIVALIYLNLSPSTSSPSQQQSVSECKPLLYNGENKINLVYIGNPKEATKFSDYFLQTPPYDDYQDSFNIFHINEQADCERYRGIALLCDKSKTTRQASACPSADIITALKEEDSRSIRSAAQGNVLSINTKITQLSVQTHEIGHRFNLAEEYTDGNPNLPRGQPNCKKDTSKYLFSTDNLTLGCSKLDYYRPSPASVMKTLQTNSYDSHNTEYIISKIKEEVPQSNSPITGQQISDFQSTCQKQNYIEYTYNTETDEYSTSVFTGCTPSQELGPNTYELTQSGSVVYSGTFSDTIFTDEFTETGEISGETYTSDEIILYLDYPLTGDQITLTDADNNIITESDIHSTGASPCLI
tara:strand:- start:570 stop:1688 length:1119 start_codon:yes stop_codon:yes gene_type:complete